MGFNEDFPVKGAGNSGTPEQRINALVTGTVPFFGDTVQYAGPDAEIAREPDTLQIIKKNAPLIGAMAGGALAPMPFKGPFLGTLAGIAGAGAGAGAGAAAQGQDLEGIGQAAGGGALSQGLGALLPTALRYGVLNPLAAGASRLAYGTDLGKRAVEYASMLKDNKALAAFKGAMDESISTLKSKGFKDLAEGLDQEWKKLSRQATFEAGTQAEQAATQHAAQVAGVHAERADQLAAAMDQMVPSWRGLQGGVRERVLGSGQQRVSDMYEAAMNAAKDRAAGESVNISAKAARTLGVPQVGDTGPKSVVGSASDPASLDTVRVDAKALIEAMTGKSNKVGYREAASALDNAGIGDPAARAEYRNAQGFIDIIDASKAIKGQSVDFDKLAAALDRVKTVNMIRRRGIGTGTEGPLRDVTRDLPPRELATSGPLKPLEELPSFPLPMPPDIKSVQMPSLNIGGILSRGLGLGHGLPIGGYGGVGVPGPRITTRAPLGQGTETALGVAPNILATLLRLAPPEYLPQLLQGMTQSQE